MAPMTAIDDRLAALETANAKLRRELADCRAELAQAREQQTATAEVLQVINSSPGDITPMFDAILEKAHRLCGVAFGSLQLYDGRQFCGVASRGNPEPLEEALRQPHFPDPDSGSGALLRGERFYQVVGEAAGQSAVNPRAKASAEAGIRTILFIPLRKGGTLIGLITAARTEVRPFSEKEIALLENFAAQAVIAMENARLITETREALEQQTATAEVLQVINASPGNLAPVFDAMLEKAMALCAAAFGGLWTFDGDRYVATALRGVPDDYAGFLARTTLLPGPGSAPYRFLHGERSVIQNLDLANEEPYRAGDPQRRALVDLGGARTALQAPLRKDGAVLGVITIYRQEVRPFSEKQIALLQNFAAQAVIAMENARLITETREALEQQTATAEVLQVINSSPGDLAPVFEAMLEKAMRLCGAAFGALHLHDGEHFRAAATRGVPEQVASLMRQPHRPPDFAQPLLDGAPLVHLADAAAVAAPEEQINRDTVEFGGVRTLLIVPLRKDGALLGTISVFRQEVRLFTDKQIALLQNFAAQAVIAMENARLLTETREALAQQTATAEVLQAINASPGDLAPVFDAILEKAHQLCDAVDGTLFLF